jgi:hypothetical protein
MRSLLCLSPSLSPHLIIVNQLLIFYKIQYRDHVIEGDTEAIVSYILFPYRLLFQNGGHSNF